MTAAITWAVLATVAAVAAFIAWWRAAEKVGPLVEKCERYSSVADGFAELFNRAQSELEAIRYTRHLSAKHARAAQLAAKRLQVVGKAAEINREMGR